MVKKLLENSDGFETLSWLVCKENEIIAYTMGFVDSNYEYIHLYPIAVRQEFLNTQALDMMLDEITRDIKKRKIKYSVISAWYKPEEDEKFRAHGYANSINKVPATIITSPMPDFALSFSLNTMYENAMVTNMLNLSMGTTTLAGPVCSAL